MIYFIETKEYAIGHGISTDWVHLIKKQIVNEISSQAMPIVDANISPDIYDDKIKK